MFKVEAVSMVKTKSLYLETTVVPAERSAAEVQAELVKAGAHEISIAYGADRIAGMMWKLRVGGSEVSFALPVRTQEIYRHLRSRSMADSEKVRQQAERIAWRHLLRWVQIQNAMIESGMAQAAEVYMPYACASGDTRYTMFEAWSQRLALLPAPEEKI